MQLEILPLKKFSLVITFRWFLHFTFSDCLSLLFITDEFSTENQVFKKEAFSI